jgi:hypothetical protein
MLEPEVSCISCLGMLFANHAAHVFRAQGTFWDDLGTVGTRHDLHNS